MADAARFPQLALPLALVGGAAGWLSAAFLSNPLIQLLPSGLSSVSAGLAAGFAAVTGALLTRWCAGRRYAYQLEAPDPAARLETDRWARHVAAVLVAGAATGATLPALHQDYGDMPLCALSGALCAAAFLPVCVAVIRAARRAQRARLGSVVAGSDRRAVWGLLAATLSVATLGGILGWPAAAAGYVTDPTPPLRMVQAAALLTLALLAADARALRQTRRALAPGLEPQNAAELGADDAALPRLDLGLGEELLARLSRGASAYRARDRMVALVQGHPGQAETALRRAVRRGVVSVVVIGAIHGAHLAADTQPALTLYQQRWCDGGALVACRHAAQLVQLRDPARAIAFYQRGCDASVDADCAAIAAIYEGAEGRAPDPERALAFHHRACEAGAAGSCRRAANLLIQRGEGSTGGRSGPALLARGCALGDDASCGRSSDPEAQPR